MTVRTTSAMFVALTVVGSFVGLRPTAATSPQPERRHAMSLVAEPRMPAGFKHFDWVNPNAPKGGRFRMFASGTYDSFNQFAVQGVPTGAVTLINERLFAVTPDEASTAYGSIAEWVSYPADYSSATFGLRDGLTFHDGQPIKVEDVIFSMEAIRAASPNYRSYWADVVSVEATGAREVTFRFKRSGNREMPHIVGELPVLPKHFWTAKGADGEPRDLGRPLREVPVGSGAYRIKAHDMGRSVVLERVANWWGTDLPVHKGQWNFDEIHLTYFQNRDVGFESFKRGDLDFWPENSAKAWATSYTFNAVTEGRVQLHRLPIKRVAPMQAFVMNTRKKAFADIRVRRAFLLAFDFEDANKKLFNDQYIRVASFFDNSEMAAKGLPTGRELEILKEIEAKGLEGLPREVFTQEHKMPVNATPIELRNNLLAATKLFDEAGYTIKNGVRTNAQGEPLAVEFMIQADGTWERLIKPFSDVLGRLGVKVSVRVVDTAQYQARKDKFDFDVIIDSFAQSESPGNEQRDFWGTASADLQGSRNTIGVKNAAIDAIVDKIIYAKDRAELVAASQALDRVLLWNAYVVPQWHLPFERFAIWNQYGRPERLPSRQAQVMRTWWFDAAAAEKLKPR